MNDAHANGADARAWGGHSMWGTLERVLVFPPVAPDASVDWQAFGYLRPIDHARAVQEHAAFRDLLTAAGVQVIIGETDSATIPDAIFPYDSVYMSDAGAIITRLGKDLRLPENALLAATMGELAVPIVGTITAPGTLDGGDCLWLDEQTLVIGRGYRTNVEGIRQMESFLRPQGVTVLSVDLPHYHGRGECLHLLSMISMLDRDLAVVHLPLMAVALVELLEERGITLVEIPDAEFETQGTNVLALGPRRCLLLRENVGTAERLRAAGCEVTLYTGDEISHNRTGGPTCLTRPILRAAH